MSAQIGPISCLGASGKLGVLLETTLNECETSI